MALDLKRPHPQKPKAFRAERTIRATYRNDERILTQEDIIDILTDMRHLCDIRELDLYEALRISAEHYIHELFNRD